DPDDFEQIVDFDYAKAQFVVRLTDGSNRTVTAVLDKLHEFAKSDAHITLIGGTAAIFYELSQTMIKGQAQSIIIALVVIMILVIMLFRSGIAGFLSSVPL